MSFLLLGLALACAAPASASHDRPASGASIGADAGAACTTAADCHGMLPHVCERCADGGSACAHFVCVAGRCETVVCGR